MKINNDRYAAWLDDESLTPAQKDIIRREAEGNQEHRIFEPGDVEQDFDKGIYDWHGLSVFNQVPMPSVSPVLALQSLEDLMSRDKQREKDGFPRRIRLGKIAKPTPDSKERIIIVPTTTEPKFFHDNSITEEEESTGGSGDGDEGEVIGEQQAEPKEGEGEGTGAGKGQGGEHDISQEAFDLGKVLTEKFELPNLKVKGKKRSFTKYTYDLTDRNREFGQILDKKETIRQVIQTNIMLGKLKPGEPVLPENLFINPKDRIYRIMSKEKDFESQAVVFFVRDYSGSMQGKPTEVIATQHLFIYSWLMFQYQNNVSTRFILHDTEAKEVADFNTYYNSQVAGGTNIFPAYDLVNKIIEEERLAVDNNIYIFHGTDGDDWETEGTKALEALKKILTYTNRFGITVAKNTWTGDGKTTVEKYIENSKILTSMPKLIRLDAFAAETASENRIIEGIKKLVG